MSYISRYICCESSVLSDFLWNNQNIFCLDAEGHGNEAYEGDENDLPLGIPFTGDQPIGIPDRFIFAPSIETADTEATPTYAAGVTEEAVEKAEMLPVAATVDVVPMTTMLEIETTPAETTPATTTTSSTTTTTESTTTREIVQDGACWCLFYTCL
jgi:hypothetical protein